MLKKNSHMQDQIPNRIEIIMQENRTPLLHHIEEFSVALLLVAVFVVGIGF
jgi:hypothetical protein